MKVDRQVGVSAKSIQRLMTRMEEEILKYQRDCRESLDFSRTPIDVVVGADETFFEEMILVLMDLPSGFIFMEEMSKERSYHTWKDKSLPPLKQWGVSVRQMVSDQAKALIKLAKEGFECSHVPDFFHAVFEISKSMGLAFHRKYQQGLAQVELLRAELDKLSEQSEKLPPYLREDLLEPKKIELKQSQEHLQQIKEARSQYQSLLQQVSKTVHPFALHEGRMQDSQQIETELTACHQQLQELQQAWELHDQHERLEKFRKQIGPIAAGIDGWWRGIQQSLAFENVSSEVSQWICSVLLPVSYWQYQVQRTNQPDIKQEYQRCLRHAKERLDTSDYEKLITKEQGLYWTQWAQAWVPKFQRTSSAVEGRNGYLSQIYQTRRGISQKRLTVLSTIHNFELRRNDGTTAANRLYQREFPDLFETLLLKMEPLPAPRRRDKTYSQSLVDH